MRNIDSTLARATDAYLSHDYVLAKKLLNGLLAKDPNNVQVLSKLGKMYVTSGDDTKALETYQKILSLQGDDFDAMNNLGGIYRRLNRNQDSIDILTKAFALKKNENLLYYNLGQTYKVMGSDKEAIDCFTKVITDNPKDVLAFNHLGCIYAKQGNHEKALEMFHQAQLADPNHPILHYNSALSLDALGRKEEAQAAYENALRKKPGWIEAMHGYADMLHRCGKNDEAENLLRKATDISSDNPKTHIALGKLLMQENNFEGAEAEFNKALELDSSNLAALTEKVSLLQKQNRADEALDLLLNLEKQMDSNITIKLQCAKLLMDIKKYSEASKRIQKILDTDPNQPDALCLLGIYFLIKGEEIKAMHCFEKGIKLKPENITYRFEAARILYEAGNYEAAEVQMRFYLSERNNDCDAWIYLGILYSEMDEIDNAIKVFKKVASMDCNNTSLLAAVSKLHKMYPDNEKVSELLESILSMHSGSTTDLSDLESSIESYENSLKPFSNDNKFAENLRLLSEQNPLAEISEEDTDIINNDMESLAEASRADDSFSIHDDDMDSLRDSTLDEDPAPVTFDIDDEEIDSNEDGFESLILGSGDDIPIDADPNDTKEEFDPLAPPVKKLSDLVEKEEFLDLQGEAPPEEPKPVKMELVPDSAPLPQQPPAQTPPYIPPAAPQQPYQQQPPVQYPPQPQYYPPQPVQYPPYTPPVVPQPQYAPPQQQTPQPPVQQPPYYNEPPVHQPQYPNPSNDAMDKAMEREKELLNEKAQALEDELDAKRARARKLKKEMQDAIRKALNKLRDKEEKPKNPETASVAEMFNYVRDLCNYLPQPKKTLFLTSDERLKLESVINRLEGKPGLLNETNTVEKIVEKYEPTPNETHTDAPTTFVKRSQEKDVSQEEKKPTTKDISNTFLYLQGLAQSVPDKHLSAALDSKIRRVLYRCDTEKFSF